MDAKTDGEVARIAGQPVPTFEQFLLSKEADGEAEEEEEESDDDYDPYA